MENVIKILELQNAESKHYMDYSGSLNKVYPTDLCISTLGSQLWCCLERLWNLQAVQPCCGVM